MKRLTDALKLLFQGPPRDDAPEDQGDQERAICLAAFGKHPGWNDHMDDLGLETQRLVNAKEMLYVEGLRSNIDSGEWEKLAEAQSGIDFSHVFAGWDGEASRDLLLGRMWASRDGKGRSRYPMVLCAHCRGVPLQWAVKEVFPRLERLQTKCLGAAEPGAVRKAMDEARSELRKVLAATEEEDFQPEPVDRSRLIENPEMGDEHQGLHRTLHQIEQDLEEYGPENWRKLHVRGKPVAPHQIRVPACAESPADAILLWHDFMRTQLDQGAPLLLVIPHSVPGEEKERLEEFVGRPIVTRADESWVDVIAGVPSASQFFCLRASLEAIPRATDIPYTLDPEFIQRAEEVAASLTAGEREQSIIKPIEGEFIDAGLVGVTRIIERKDHLVTKVRSFWAKLLGGALLVAGLGAVLILAAGRKPHRPEPPPATTSIPPTEAAASFDPEEWRELCDAYYDWLGLLFSKLREPERHRRWSRETCLTEKVLSVYDQVRDKTLEIDPRVIARVSVSQSIPKLRDKPPVRARSEQSAQKTQKAVAAVKSILDGLTSSESGLPQSLTRFAAKCRELDWTQAAGEADALVASIKVGPNLAESVDKVLVSKGHADRGLVLIDGLQAFGEKAQALDDQELVQAAEAARNGLGTLSDKSLAELSAALTAMSAEAAKAGGAWLEKVTGEEEISSSPALNALWKERRAQRLLEAKGHVAAGELTQWLSVSQKLVAVRSLLSAIDDEAQLPPGAPEALDEFSVKEWPIALGAALAAKREAVVTQLAGEALKSHEGEPVTGEELKGRDQWKTACEEYARWRSDGVRTLQDLFAIRTLLEGCYLLDETGAGDEKTILQLLQDCQGRPVFGAEQVEVLAAPIAERVGLLREIGALADRKALIARAQSVEPERPWVASRAVWLKLRGAKDPVWPHGAEEQALEEELVKRLWAGYGKFPDDVRRAVLQVELRRAEIADQSRALTKRNAGLKDKILAAVPACVQGVYTKTGETPPPDQLKVLDTLRKTLQDVLAAAIEIENGKIDRALFQETGSVYQSFAGEVSPQLLSQWVAELKGFRLLAEDPRGKRDEWTSALVKKRKSLDNLARLSASSSVPTKQEVQALEAQYQKAQETVDKLWRVPAVAREKAAIEKLKTQAGSELDALGDALAKSIASAEPPDAWRKRMLKVQTVSASQVLDAIWLERRDQITGSLDQKSSDTDWGAYAEARARMERLKAFLVGLDDRDHLPLPDAALTEETRKKLGTALAEVLTKAILEQREASLKQSAEAALKGGEVPAMGMAEFRKQKQWTESCATYRQWIDDAAGLLVTIESIRRATDEGWPLDAKPDGGKDHIRGMYETALGSQALKQPTIAAAVKPVADGVERLKSIAAEKDRSELVAVTKEAATDGPDFGLAAWRRLGVLAKQPWPSDLAEMTQETEIHSRVLARVSGRADSATKERLLKELLTESARRWQKGFNRLLPTDIAPAVGLLEKLGLKAADVDPFAKRLGPAENLLGPQAQYNLLLQQALVSKSPADEGVPPVCKQFVQAVKQKLPALATNKSVGVFTQALEALGRGEEVGDGDLTKAGPSVSRFGEWKTEIHDEGRSVDYVWKHGGTTHKLHFVKMEASGEVKKSFYLAATEVPLRLFADVISSSGRWDDFEKLLPGHEGIAGPLCWQQDKVGRKIETRAEWVRQTVKLAIKPGAKRETPADGCPIHWISASSAICFSRLLGCRLPSSTEWRQVYAKHRIEQAKAQPNLRDKSWDGERATISWTAKSSPSQALHLEWPDDGVFWPSNIGWAARKEQEKAVPVTENDDGTVWFAPVSSSGTGIFKHLVGNVAELAFEQPESLEQLSDLSATSAGGFVAKNVAHFRVIGGSALSPAEVKADQPYAMDLTQATQGRSDVGLRLAFTAPKQTPSQRLKALLDPPPYLTAAD